MAATIKVIGAEANIPTTAANFSSSAVIRLFNSGSSTHVITLTTSADAAIGDFTMNAKEIINIQKTPSDKIAVDSGTDVKGVPLAFSA